MGRFRAWTPCPPPIQSLHVRHGTVVAVGSNGNPPRGRIHTLFAHCTLQLANCTVHISKFPIAMGMVSVMWVASFYQPGAPPPQIDMSKKPRHKPHMKNQLLADLLWFGWLSVAYAMPLPCLSGPCHLINTENTINSYQLLKNDDPLWRRQNGIALAPAFGANIEKRRWKPQNYFLENLHLHCACFSFRNQLWAYINKHTKIT